MATNKITQKELEEIIREMVTKMVNEVPGEAPIMEKHLTSAEEQEKEKIVKALKPKYGKTPKTYAIATAQAKKLAELEGRRKAIIQQLEELDFGGPGVAEPDTDTDTEEEIITTTPPAPGRPNPFRREDDDTEVVPDLPPQGSLEDVIRRYLKLKK